MLDWWQAMRAVALFILLVCLGTLTAARVFAQVDSAGTGVAREVPPPRDTLLRPAPLSLLTQQATPLLFDASLDSLLQQDPELRSAILRYLLLALGTEPRPQTADEELNRRLRAMTQFSQFEVMGLVAKREQENARKPPTYGRLGQLSITGLIHLIEDLTK